MAELLRGNNLVTQFKTESDIVKAVHSVSYYLDEQEIIRLVGESGCGKTTVGRCVLGLYYATGGKIVFQGEDVTALREKRLRAVRKNIALIFQDPYSSLHPRQSAWLYV